MGYKLIGLLYFYILTGVDNVRAYRQEACAGKINKSHGILIRLTFLYHPPSASGLVPQNSNIQSD